MKFYAPVIPYTPIDALNRRAAALGSPSYASRASQADYNGHQYIVWWNSYRKYYIASYTWAGHNVIARGEFASCLNAALVAYKRGALGSSVVVALEDNDEAAIAICRNTPELVEGDKDPMPWYTWKHRVAASCARDSANRSLPVPMFDWEIMQVTESEKEYEEAIRAKYGKYFY